MSRIGKLPIFYSKDIKIKLINNIIYIKGQLGTLNCKINSLILIKIKNKKISFKLIKKKIINKVILGTFRALINNMINGVSIGYEKKLILVGVGFKVFIKNNRLNLFIGFSHIIKYNIPLGIFCEILSSTEIIIRGIDRQLVGQVASEIRLFRVPDPYKGKGIRYFNENIILKESKKK
ncbi:50S ribosomal protein L6 [Candidatus Zinderia endosymbiont of Aphrophora alni]|uniref:50S ribosomal protein L6 n=1 Tax=Candidatus Zinderia endosymbiont of Aphrophora alni TaxID=3077951 RepID=UPI0030CB479C